MDNQHSASNATQKRKTRAYRIVIRLAMETGHMANERDVEGFERWCDEFERVNVPIEQEIKLPISRV